LPILTAIGNRLHCLPDLKLTRWPELLARVLLSEEELLTF